MENMKKIILAVAMLAVTSSAVNSMNFRRKLELRSLRPQQEGSARTSLSGSLSAGSRGSFLRSRRSVLNFGLMNQVDAEMNHHVVLARNFSTLFHNVVNVVPTIPDRLNGFLDRVTEFVSDHPGYSFVEEVEMEIEPGFNSEIDTLRCEILNGLYYLVEFDLLECDLAQRIKLEISSNNINYLNLVELRDEVVSLALCNVDYYHDDANRDLLANLVNLSLILEEQGL